MLHGATGPATATLLAAQVRMHAGMRGSGGTLLGCRKRGLAECSFVHRSPCRSVDLNMHTISALLRRNLSALCWRRLLDLRLSHLALA